MIRYILMFGWLLSLGFSIPLVSAQLILNPNCHLVLNPNVHLNLQDLDLDNRGFLNTGMGSLHLTGGTNTRLGGSQIIRIEKLTVHKNGAEVSLTNQIEVLGQVILNNGNLDLDGNLLDLLSTGRLLNEAANRKIYSSSGNGRILRETILNNVVSADSGQLGLDISSAANLGQVRIERGHAVQAIGGGSSIQRYYEVNPVTNTNLNASLRFHYFDNELNALSEADLEFFQSTNAGVSYQPIGFASKDPINNFVELSGLNSLSRFTLSTPTVFPVKWLSFEAEFVDREVRCRWITASEYNTDYFELEKSTDGSDFQWVGTVDAAGNSQTQSSYELFDAQPYLGRSYYRVKQVDQDGSFSYSSLAEMNIRSGGYISLYPNPTQELSFLSFNLESATQVQVLLFDLKGRQIRIDKFELDTGYHLKPIKVSDLAEGIYTLQVRLGEEVRILRLEVW